MKVFIYHNLIDNPAIKNYNAYLTQLNRLFQQHEYLEDFYDFFKQYETPDPEQADYFFIPWFLTGWQFANLDPADFINLCPYLHKGKHILVATGDFGQRAETRHELKIPGRAYEHKFAWLDSRFILLALESTASLQEQDIAFLPYATQPIPAPTVPRDLYLTFMGKLTQLHLGPEHIRGGRLLTLRSTTTNPDIIIGTPDEWKQRFGESATYHGIMARSHFTLCPAGYGRWTFRLVEALLNGSIPVVVADDYIMPFADAIHWADYAVFVPEDRFDDIDAMLGQIPCKTVFTMLHNIQRDRHLFERAFTLNQVASILESRIQQPVPLAIADQAIARMRAPGQMEIICIDVTNKCDLACSNCTRLLKNQDESWEMTPDNFRKALRSLANYPGIIAMIGGNPCMHSQFAALCQIFQEEIPQRRQRGLWTNNIFKHGAIIEATFGGFNLNPHNNPRAVKPLRELYEKMVLQEKFNGGFYAGCSEHAPILTAVKDVLDDEATMWDAIARCDINRDWSATIIQNKGQLRFYFCEVAASFDLARNEDHGCEVVLDWWKLPIQACAAQIKQFCPGCGVPARLKGHWDHEKIDTYTRTNADLALKAKQRSKRKIICLDQGSTETLSHKVTKYSETSK
jgi:hypothetical protein